MYVSNVEKDLLISPHYVDIEDPTLVRSLMCVSNVGKLSAHSVTVEDMEVFTPERNPIYVNNVGKNSLQKNIFRNMKEIILRRNFMCVNNVRNLQQYWSNVKKFTLGTNYVSNAGKHSVYKSAIKYKRQHTGAN